MKYICIRNLKNEGKRFLVYFVSNILLGCPLNQIFDDTLTAEEVGQLMGGN